MAQVSTHLNFIGNTKEAFEFYRKIFGTNYAGPIRYMRDVPLDPTSPPLSEDEKSLVMHVELPIIAGHSLMGTDALQSMGQELTLGNNMSINLDLDTRAEVDRLFAALSESGSDLMRPQKMFWGGYFGMCRDKFGVGWIFNTDAAA